MAALYEDVEAFFGGIFAWIGRFVARYPEVFITISVLSSGLMGLGLLSLEYETSVQKLYTPMKSVAIVNQSNLEIMFPDETKLSFYGHQLVWSGTYGDIIVTCNNGITAVADECNVFNDNIIQDVRKLHSALLEMAIDDEERGHTYEDLCARRDGVCVVDGEKMLATDFKKCLKSYTDLDNNTSSHFLLETDDFESDLRFVLGDITVENECIAAKSFRLRYNLMHDTSEQRVLSLLWERKFLTTLQSIPAVNAKYDFCVSESLDIEIADHLGVDIKYFSFTIIIMIVYTTLVTGGGDWVSTRVFLGWAGIIAALLGILASFGIVCRFGLKFVDICGVMPFLILGLGVDDMFILMAGFRATDIKLPVEERLAETYRSSAISVTITSLTNMLAFCVGATSPFLSIKNFCIFAGVAVCICYFNQLTFFGGCLALHAKRVESSRHCITCLKTKPRQDLDEDVNISKCQKLFCCGETPKQSKQDESLCERIPSRYLPKFLMHIPVKILILGLFIIYLTAAVIGTSKIQTGLKLQTIVPENSYLAKFIAKEQQYFSHVGPHVMLVATEYVDYRKPEVLKELNMVFILADQTGYINKDYKISWFHDFISFLDKTNITKTDKMMQEMEEEEVYVQLKIFLSQNQQYRNDILWNKDKTNIDSTRFYVRSNQFTNSTQEGNMMKSLRYIASNSSLPLLAYSPEFVFYEHYLSIMKDTLLAVGIAVIGMLFIALAFIPHPIAITCVLITMITIVLGMFGFMYFWGLPLSAITSVQIILSVGFCVDFTVHISHAFMAASGKNRNLRVIHALEKVGVPILNGAISSVLGILMLAFAKSYVFQSFFKTMLLVILLGLGHSLLVLPVVFSFCGPRRTARARIFIPISPDFKIGVNMPSPSPRKKQGSAERMDSTNMPQNTTDDTNISSEFNEIHRLDNSNRVIDTSESLELIHIGSPQDENVDLLSPVVPHTTHGYLLEQNYQNSPPINRNEWTFLGIDNEGKSDDAEGNVATPNWDTDTSPNLNSLNTHNAFPQQLEARDLLVQVHDNEQQTDDGEAEENINPFLGQNEERNNVGARESCSIQ